MCSLGGDEAILKGSLKRGILAYSMPSSQLAGPEKSQKDGFLTCSLKQLSSPPKYLYPSLFLVPLVARYLSGSLI